MNYNDQYPTTWHMSHCFLLCEVGSTAHGTGLPGREDHDEMGICLEPPEFRLGLEHFETLVWRPNQTDPYHDPSGPEDLDLVLHSLHKWVKLALGGNPSILALLFAPTLHCNELGDQLRAMSEKFVSQKAIAAFLGYMTNQKIRLENGRGKHGPYRKELIETFGYDTKYAGHAIRLGLQGIELHDTGKIEYPAKERELIYAVRTGKYSKDEVMLMIETLEHELALKKKSGQLPPTGDRSFVNMWMEDTYFSFYSKEYF